MVMFDIRGNELFLCIFFAKNHGTDLVQNIYFMENIRTIKTTILQKLIFTNY